MKQNHNWCILCRLPALLFFLIPFTGEMALAQRFTIDTTITTSWSHTDTIPEITV
jgi:hypothetical protein